MADFNEIFGFKDDWTDAPEEVQRYVEFLKEQYPDGVKSRAEQQKIWTNLNKMINPKLNEKESEIKSILNLNRKQIETYSPAQKEALLDSLNVFSKKGYEQYTPSFMHKKTEEPEKGLGSKPFPILKSNLSDAIQNLEAFKNAPGDTVYVSNAELDHLKKHFGTTSPDSTTVYDPKTLGLKTIKKEKATPTPEPKKKQKVTTKLKDVDDLKLRLIRALDEGRSHLASTIQQAILEYGPEFKADVDNILSDYEKSKNPDPSYWKKVKDAWFQNVANTNK